jgi:Zn-finger nucleic acid-binding protein
LNCPKCSDSLLIKILGDLDFCSRCCGIWFDKGETAKFFTLSQDILDAEALAQTAEKKGLRCPRCEQELAEFNYVDGLELRLDYCAACRGLWFDVHETEKLMQYINEKSAPLARLAKVLAEKKEV